MSNKEECASWYNNYLKKNILKKSKDYSQQHQKRTNHNLSFANWLMHKHQEDIETLGVSKELREKACYDIHEHFEEQLAQQAQQQAITLINKIKHLLVSA